MIHVPYQFFFHSERFGHKSTCLLLLLFSITKKVKERERQSNSEREREREELSSCSHEVHLMSELLILWTPLSFVNLYRK